VPRYEILLHGFLRNRERHVCAGVAAALDLQVAAEEIG
jgi:hypothetical protein